MEFQSNFISFKQEDLCKTKKTLQKALSYMSLIISFYLLIFYLFFKFAMLIEYNFFSVTV